MRTRSNNRAGSRHQGRLQRMRVRPPTFRSPLRVVPVMIRGHRTPFLAAEIGLRIISAPKNRTSVAPGSSFGGGHHPIIYMQCGPIRYKLSARSMTAASPFEHEVIPRLTEFCLPPEQTDTTIQELYAALVVDNTRNEMIAGDLLRAVQDGSSPLLLTARTEHLKYFETAFAGKVESVFVLKGGMGKEQRRSIAEAIAAVPEDAPRVILATGSYIGEGFDDARLDTLFLAMPISWKGTLQQYVGRLHRLHDTKRVVRVYDYVDSNVPMLARMYARRLKGYSAIGYRISNIPDEVFGTERQAASREERNTALLG